MTANQGRRRLLKQLCASGMTTLVGCRWDGETSSPLGAPPPSGAAVPSVPGTQPPAPVGSTAWDPAVPPLLVGSNATFDLSRTLPASIAHGGRFAIDASGPPLPVGMTLSTIGILAVGAAAIGTVAGVVFTYEAP